MPHFPHFQNQIEKWGISRILNIKKCGHFEENHVIDFKTRKRPKMNMFDFGTFQDFQAYALTCKIYPSHAFWGISKNLPYHQEVHFSSKTSLRIEKMIKVSKA